MTPRRAYAGDEAAPILSLSVRSLRYLMKKGEAGVCAARENLQTAAHLRCEASPPPPEISA
jgi:hypothetical protein